jgi:hypothetical protein
MLWTASELIISFMPFVDSYILSCVSHCPSTSTSIFGRLRMLTELTDTILVINLAGRFVYLRTTQTFEIREQTESTLGHQAA